MNQSCLRELDLGHCLGHVALGVNFFFYRKRERNEVYLDSPHHVQNITAAIEKRFKTKIKAKFS